MAIVGVYKAMAGKVSGATSGVFRAVLVGIAVQKLSKESQVKYTVEEARLMRQVRACGFWRFLMAFSVMCGGF